MAGMQASVNVNKSETVSTRASTKVHPPILRASVEKHPASDVPRVAVSTSSGAVGEITDKERKPKGKPIPRELKLDENPKDGRFGAYVDSFQDQKKQAAF